MRTHPVDAGPAPPADFVLRDWLVQPALSRISRQGGTVHLRPRLMDLLVFLASLGGRVAGRQELAHMWYSHLLTALGREQEAMDEAEAAAEPDPLSPTVRASIGLRLYESRRIEAALATWQSIVAMEPDFALAHFHLGRACPRSGAIR